MARIGRLNILVVKQITGNGALLDGGSSGDIPLSRRDRSHSCRPGDEVEVFVYVDRDKRLRATTRKPYVTVGQVARLRTVATTKFGAYLAWGLENDLFVPSREQRVPMEKGQAYMVYVYLDDRSGRVAASSKLNRFLGLAPPNYNEGEPVEVVISEATDLGYKAVVDHAHWGLIYHNEALQTLEPGQRLNGYIKAIRDDSKIDISLRQTGHKGIDTLSNAILSALPADGGRLSVSDKSPAEEIYALFGVSKKRFKKAVGALYKRRLIVVDKNGIRLPKKELGRQR